jgi:serine/threonine-protein kinase
MGSHDDAMSGQDTLADDRPEGERAPRLSLPGYDVGAAIGEGGMGEVLLARDSKIGRDVAIKRMRTASPSIELVDRFLREAKIQARLDHPAIVPVYELGYDTEGRPYFTMKRLAGTTLLDRLGKDGASQQSLLRAFVDVCLAIDFAHVRGVVHRDLKPANIMLGDYGEVYVLDWGVARVLTRERATTAPVGTPSLAPETQHTQAGALLGTPGYMSPEQARGEEVGLASDVYALGAILFELLAGEALHARGNTLQSTLKKPTDAPARRRPERAIAPELDAACTAALAADPDQRPTARELGDRIQRYLDGDRDLERRRALAAEHVSRARAAAGDVDRRGDAIRDAGRALALDPESPDAAALVMTLMLEPPKQLPAQLVRHLESIDNTTSVQSARMASIALSSAFLLLPFLLWARTGNGWMFAAAFTVIGMLAIDARLQVRRGRTNDLVPLTLGTLLLALVGLMLSPFVLVPVAICGFIVGLGGQPQLLRRPKLVFAAGATAFFAPLVLQALHVVPESWSLSQGRLVVLSSVLRLEGTPGYIALIAGHALVIALVCIFLRTVTASRRRARNEVEIQAWQLRQMLPAPPPSPELEALIAADCKVEA